MAGAEVSVVVPVLRDAAALASLLAAADDQGRGWIVVNGGEWDAPLVALREAYPEVVWVSSSPGRGVQMAAGVARADRPWVLVLHADTRLPPGWRDELGVARARGHRWGCFRLRLDTSAWQARLMEVVVRGRVRLFRLPYGDQAMFFDRATLMQTGGVPSVPLMEDVLLARRFARLGPPYRSRRPAVTSARRWERDGWARRTIRNWSTLARFMLGVPAERLAGPYASSAAPAGRRNPAEPGAAGECSATMSSRED